MSSKLIRFLQGFKFKNDNILLGRWCHINVPKCNNEIILKKIDFANIDNTFEFNNKNNKNNKNDKNYEREIYNTEDRNKNFKPQDYINAMLN